MENKELALRFINGGEDVLEEVIDIYSEKLLRYATSILCDHYEAEDVVQECFIAAYKNRTDFDGQYISSWLYKITYNMSLNKIKKRKLIYFGNMFIKETQKSKYTDGFSDNTLRALKKLKPEDRALIHARIIEDMTYNELSLQMGVSEEALRKRYQRAKDKLVREFENRKEYNYEKKK